MKIFEKKTNNSSLSTLNEKEIQRRLYGKYHLESNSKAAALKADPNSSRLEVPKVVNSSPASSAFKDFAVGFQKILWTAGRKFPWTFAAIITSALALSIILLQILSIWFGRMNSSTQSEMPVMKAIPQERKASAPSLVLSPSTTGPAITKPAAEVSKKKYYAVQVCTYQKEQDAARLAAELKASNFNAFYLRMASSQQRQPHYVVFLGKEETYIAAHSKLNAFRRTRYFEQFSDSYIRSI